MNVKSTVKNASPVLGLALGLLLPQSAQCFYNPSTGRWLNRDPLGERGGANLYCAVANCAVNSTDILGLETVVWDERWTGQGITFNWRVRDLGQRPPERGRSGETTPSWVVNVWTAPCTDGVLRMVRARGDADISYWWSVDPAHELGHVSIYHAAFRGTFDSLQAFTGTCMCPPKAECYRKLGTAIWEMYKAYAKYGNDVYDCLSYGDTFGACSRAPGELTEYNDRVSEVTAWGIKCHAME